MAMDAMKKNERSFRVKKKTQLIYLKQLIIKKIILILVKILQIPHMHFLNQMSFV